MEDGDGIPRSTLDRVWALVQNAQGPVLIHCAAGLSRSASVAVAMMRARGIEAREARRRVEEGNGYNPGTYPMSRTFASALAWAPSTQGTRIGVVGTAGRDGNTRLGPVLYANAFHKLAELVGPLPKPWHFVSGGAAWMDHLAVLAYLGRGTQPITLDLHLPCPWVVEQRRYLDNGLRDWKENPGGTMNYYHRLFGGMMRGDTLLDVHNALQTGAVAHVHPGLRARNLGIAQNVDQLIAFTWGAEGPPLGGTAHTWATCPAHVVKRHVSLHTLLP